MTKQLVISALGEDRPGIVNELSDIILKLSLNIEDSRMSVLGGEFAIQLLVTGEDHAIETLQLETADIEKQLKLIIIAKPTHENRGDGKTVPYRVEVSSLDHQGIVHSITSFFSGRNINIVNLETERYPAPHTGSPMFALHMTIGVNADTSIAQLRDAFYQLCDEHNLDAELSNL